MYIIGFLKIKLFYCEKRFLFFDKIKGFFSLIIMGMVFVVGWILCIGFILLLIFIYVVNMDFIGRGVLLLVMYFFGFVVLFVFIVLVIDGFFE